MSSESHSMNRRTRCHRRSSSSLETYSLSSMAPSYEMEFIDLIDSKMLQPRIIQLPSDFVGRICRMERCDKVAVKNWRRIASVFVHQFDSGFRTCRSQEIDHEYRRPRFGTICGSSPQSDRICKMMKK